VKISRSLVKTSSGHVHVRSAGEGKPLILMHWTPASGRQFGPLLPLFANAGFAAYAPDHMGYGQSDPRPTRWEIAEYADTIAELMGELALESAAIVGGHLSSEIAVELSLRHPDRVTHLVLDGSPVWDRAFREQVLATARQPAPDWAEDGSHIAWVWERSVWLQKMWDSNFELDDDSAAFLRGAVIDSLLAQQSDDSADALKNYDMEAALKQVSKPVLALTAKTDPLNNCHAKVLDLVPGASGHEFSGSHPIHHAENAAQYVDVIVRFLTGQAREE